MKLYHGTSATVARKALLEGLKPRSFSNEKGNWGQTVPSNPDLVYLTIAYAPYFAMCASPEGEDWGIVEIDTDLLNEANLLPDEDFLEQASRWETPPKGLKNASMEKRTLWFRNRIHDFQHLWETSLRGLGNVAHLGPIPKEAITRVSFFSPDENPQMMFMAADPSISILNYQILGEKYRTLTRWFSRYTVEPSKLVGMGFDISILPESMRVQYEQEINQLREMAHKGLYGEERLSAL